jgi:hypothetical protein
MTQPWDRYVVERLVEDLETWLPADGPVVEAPRPVDEFLAPLPAATAAALAHWDNLAWVGAIPDMFLFEEGGMYGFDFTANDVEVYDGGVDVSARLWMLGHDGGGNGYCVLPSGEVGIWNHETNEIEQHNRFPSLDSFAWALVRVSAIEAGTLDRDDPEVADLMDSQVDGCRFLVSQLGAWLDDR